MPESCLMSGDKWIKAPDCPISASRLYEERVILDSKRLAHSTVCKNRSRSDSKSTHIDDQPLWTARTQWIQFTSGQRERERLDKFQRSILDCPQLIDTLNASTLKAQRSTLRKLNTQANRQRHSNRPPNCIWLDNEHPQSQIKNELPREIAAVRIARSDTHKSHLTTGNDSKANDRNRFGI